MTFLFLLFYGAILYFAINLSFSIVDVESIEKFPILNYILKFSIYIFGHNDFALRFPSIFISFLSIILFWNLSKLYFKKEEYANIATIVFAMLPGFIISTILINKSIYIIFLVLLFIYLFHKYYYLSLVLLASYTLIDYNFIVLYFSLIFYSIYKKDNFLLVFSLFMLAINANYFLSIGGKPRGHFLELFAIYFLIFSPFVFVYFLFSIYKGIVDKKRDVLFFIVFFTFIFSIILSFRQRIRVDDFAPFLLVYVIYMVKYFLNSYKVRLPRFRLFYKIILFLMLLSLILFNFLIFFHPAPLRKDISSFYFIKPLSKEFKNKKVYCNMDSLCRALYFYGVKRGKDYYIYFSKKRQIIKVYRDNKLIKSLNVSKINK